MASGRSRDLTHAPADPTAAIVGGVKRYVLLAASFVGLVSPFGVVETLPFAGGRAHVIVKGPCRASWND